MKAHNFIDLSGQRFERLLVIKQAERIKPKVTRWHCVCDCGKEVTVDTRHLRHNGTKSCGCLKSEVSGNINKTHGLTDSKEYKIWCGMKRRCYNKNERSYKNYGARGITVCKEWIDSFENFLFDMGKCPDGFSIERKDVNGQYCKENCVWIPLVDQGANRTSNVLITFDGMTKTVSEWARFVGLKPFTLQARLSSGRWTIEKAITTKKLMPNHPKNLHTPPR